MLQHQTMVILKFDTVTLLFTSIVYKFLNRAATKKLKVKKLDNN